jgi:hypothetical protein
LRSSFILAQCLGCGYLLKVELLKILPSFFVRFIYGCRFIFVGRNYVSAKDFFVSSKEIEVPFGNSFGYGDP